MPAPKPSDDDLPANNAEDHDEEEEEEEEDEEQEEEDDGDGEEEDEEEEEEEDDDDDDEDEDEDDDDDDEKQGPTETDGGSSTSSDENSDSNGKKKGEFIVVRLSDIRKEVQCPICLGIIRKTRTVMECLHRFCRECIDKSMRMGNNECPACRTHCASRRSLRDDPNYDSLIAALYPDIDQYEEEELAFQEEEKLRNKQIQAAIAQTFRRQTEALSRKRRRSQGNYRRRRNYRSEDDDYANGHDGGKDSSSADEHCTEAKARRSKRWRGQSSSAVAGGEGGVDEHDQEVHRDSGAAPAGLVGSSEMLAWGKGGMRSNTRYGSGSGASSKHSRSRLAKLADHLRNSDENDDELEIQVVLVSLDEQKASSMQHSYLCGRPALSVGQLCQFIALQTSLSAEEVEILAAKGVCPELSSLTPTPDQNSSSIVLDACKDELQVLDSEETLAGLKSAYNFTHGQLMLAYRQKLST